MKPLSHLIISIVAALIFVYLGMSIVNGLLFIATSVLIDIDHIFYFVFEFRIYSLKGWFLKSNELMERMQPGLYVFHSPEFVLLLSVLMLESAFLLPIFGAIVLHVICDIIAHCRYHKNITWIKEWSIIRAVYRKLFVN